MSFTFHEARFTIRRLFKRPSASLVAVVTLACGIGAAASTYSLLSSVLLRPLPVESADRMMVVGGRYATRGGQSRMSLNHTYPIYQTVRDFGAFDDVAAGGRWTFLVAEGGVARPRSIYFASHNFFDALGVRLALGSGFVPDDDQRGAPLKAVLSDRYWRQAFDADPRAIGRTLTISGKPAHVVGVAPRQFRGLSLAEAPDLYLPLHTVGDVGSPSANYFSEPVGKGMSSPYSWIAIVGRLHGGTSPTQAAAKLNTLPIEVRRGSTFDLVPVNRAAIPEAAREGLTQYARLLAVTVALLLLIGSLTVGMLLLIRTEARRDEFAMCLALGATRARLAFGVVVEGALLSAAGAVLALPVAWWLTAALRTYQLPGGIDIGLLDLQVDARTTLSAVVGALASTLIVAGVAGAFGWTANLADVLRARAGGTPRLTRRRTRSALVVVQVAVTLVLLAGAALFGRSLIAALQLNPGFETSRLVSASLSLRPIGYTRERATTFFDELRARMSQHPEIRSAALYQWEGGMSPGGRLIIDGEHRAFPSMVSYTAVDQHYFSTMGMRVVRGRDFTDDDRPGSPLVIIVSESFGRMLASGGDPIGHKLTESSSRIGQPPDVAEIVGVVPDVVTNVSVLEPLVIYYSRAQRDPSESATLLLRAGSDGPLAAREAMAAIRQMDAAISPPPMLTMQERIGLQMGPQQFGALVLGVLGAIAVILTILGAYVLAESMAAVRLREMGIRAALGATRTALGGLLIAQTARLVGLGLILGLVLAWLGAGTIRAFLFQVQPLDPWTLAAVAAVILGLALLVSLRPAVRAARADLARVLRED